MCITITLSFETNFTLNWFCLDYFQKEEKKTKHDQPKINTNRCAFVFAMGSCFIINNWVLHQLNVHMYILCYQIMLHICGISLFITVEIIYKCLSLFIISVYLIVTFDTEEQTQSILEETKENTYFLKSAGCYWEKQSLLTIIFR